MEDVPLQAPPPVSGSAYATGFTSETESNYLRGGLTITGAYSNNIAGGGTSNPVGGPSYSLWPTLALDKTTSRGHYLLTYSPGFTFYPQHKCAQPSATRMLPLDLQYRLSPNATVSIE